MYLLDVNVLLALGYEEHVHHLRAEDWLNAQHAAGAWTALATCSISELGFVRVASGKSGFADNVTTGAGCTDLSPIHRELQDIRSQVGQLSTQVGAMKASLDSATQSARQAQEASENASRTANQAMALAQSDQQSIDAMNQKLDRILRRRPAK